MYAVVLLLACSIRVHPTHPMHGVLCTPPILSTVTTTRDNAMHGTMSTKSIRSTLRIAMLSCGVHSATVSTPLLLCPPCTLGTTVYSYVPALHSSPPSCYYVLLRDSVQALPCTVTLYLRAALLSLHAPL